MILKEIADHGVSLKIFGDTSNAPDIIRKHRNIDVLGRVTDLELRDLYSNSLFTLFAFTHEPFGYIPVESMACGTPVLTFNKQGPSETVIHGETGWVASNSKELVRMAKTLWKNKYSTDLRAQSVKRMQKYDVRRIVNDWVAILKTKAMNEIDSGTKSQSELEK